MYNAVPSAEGAPLKPQEVLQELQRQIDGRDDVVITTGVGQHQMFAAQFLKYRRPHSWVSSGGLGTMGFGIPSAIGAKIARPDLCVIDVDGDGSFMMTCMEVCPLPPLCRFKCPERWRIDPMIRVASHMRRWRRRQSSASTSRSFS
eukprot:SAG11_NODE_408_length_9704_cov_6.496774_11_plen_146_part_00